LLFSFLFNKSSLQFDFYKIKNPKQMLDLCWLGWGWG